ncbi:MAG: glutamate mutase L, partial [Candidatus Eisenbacteria bacterium]|nr:glutamate mutase L [Candidatus Eisenbacteria bacterium]
MTGSPSLQSDAICIVDVGSTTTKAILFRRDEAWRCERYEAPTTVEKPEEDVIIGVRRALAGLAERSGRALLRDGRPLPPFLCTSSAGGGLAMVVTGLVREVTTRSAERVALGAGAILLDVIAMDDGRTPYEKIEALRRLRPDMVLLAGGFDGEALSGPVFLAELIREAGLRPKLSAAARLPVIYAGNANAREFARRTLGDEFHFHAVPNLRPASEREHLEPAREAIHEVFMEHVMSQAPGYEALKACVTAPILPTPAAFAGILALASREMNQRILAVDIGGATTDVFTAHGGHVLRTVSANLGMSYSILEVARRGGLEAIRELIRADGAAGGIGAAELWDEIGAKHLRPTRLPADERQREIERAVGAVAIREAVREHLQVLRGVGLSRAREELHLDRFGPRPRRRSVEGTLTLEGYDLVIGSGGLLSHSPRAAAARILADALRPRRKTELAVDSAFMFPHLGALARLDPPLALRLFRELGLVRLAGAEEPPPGEDPRPARGEGPAGGAGWA